MAIDVIRAETGSVPVACAAELVEWGGLAAAAGGAGGKRFSVTGYTGAAMNLGFGVPVVVDLAGLSVPRQDIPALRQHNPNRVVGHTETVTVSAQRLKATGVVSGTGEDASEVLANAAGGFPWQASMGADIVRQERVDAGQKVNVNGRTFTGPLIVVRASVLREISFVPLGADGATSAAIAASYQGSPMSFDDFVKAAGFDPATLSDAQRQFLTAQHVAAGRSPSPPDPPRTPPDDSLEAITAQARADNTRRQGITAAAKKHMTADPSITDNIERIAKLAIDTNMTVSAAELEMMKLAYGRGPAVAVGAGRPTATEEVVTAAMCLAAGLGDLEKAFSATTLEAAHQHFRGGVGLQEAIDLCARSRGYDGRGSARDLSGTIRAALAPAALDIRAGASGPSTYSLPNILGNVANKFAAKAFDGVDDSWKQIADIKSVQDFKTRSSFALTGDFTIEEVAPGGEIKHATFGENGYTNQAKSYAKMVGVERRDLINDDLGVLSDIGTRMGRGGALGFNRVFWGKFLNNAGFFTTARGNAATGAGTALSVDSLTQADTLFANQVDPDGQPVAVAPKILLVPPALRVPAMRLMGSQGLVLVGTSGNVVERGDMNPFAGTLRVVSTPYLSNPTFTGYSAAAWYELADPSDMPVIQAVFLNGNQRPTLESSDMEFNMLGLAWRVFFDFGVELQEYRGGVRMAGA